MKSKLFLSIISVILSTYCYGQNDIKKEYYDNGELKTETPLTNGKKNGVEKSYYKGGILKREIPYINNKANGIAKYYYENGNLERETYYSDEKANGIAKCYYESGILKSEIAYTDNKANGIAKYYYESGKLESETSFFDGMISGIEKLYDENGKLKQENGQTPSLYSFYENGKWGFKDIKGVVVLPAQFDHVSDFSDGLALVNIGGNGPYMQIMKIDESNVYGGIFKFIDTNGKVVIDLDSTYMKVTPFSEGLAAIEVEGEFGGFIDKTGKLVIPLFYEIPASFHDGLSRVTKYTENGDFHVGYINKKGEVIIPLGLYQVMDNFSDSVAFMLKGEKLLLVDTEGKILISDFQYGYLGMIHGFSEGLVACYEPGDFNNKGYANKRGELVIGFQYSKATKFQEGLALVNYMNDYYFINQQGTRVIALPANTHWTTRSFSEGLAAISDENLGWYYIDKSGNKSFDGYFKHCSDFHNGVAGVTQGDESFFIDKTGKRIR